MVLVLVLVGVIGLSVKGVAASLGMRMVAASSCVRLVALTDDDTARLWRLGDRRSIVYGGARMSGCSVCI